MKQYPNPTNPIVVCWERFGPYHHARLGAAGKGMEVVGLEVSAIDKTYAWATVEGADGFRRRTLFSDRDAAVASAAELDSAITRALGGQRPAMIAVPGWSARYALALLRWARRCRVPTVLMSDSTAVDEQRRPHKELIKRRLLRMYDAALVGGTPQSDYLVELGFPRERLFDGYDAVDNQHFAQGAAVARRDGAEGRRRIGAPERYFLASSRFVARKNLLRLLDAYALYRRSAGDAAWPLVVLGDGELRGEVETRRRALDLEAQVLLPGFKQYDELPAWYGHAGAFVHAAFSEQWGLVVNEAMAAGLPVLVSSRCGCANDLVRENENGFTFDPDDTFGLAALLTRVAQDEAKVMAMGEASSRIVRGWGLDRFTSGLEQAALTAMSTRSTRLGLLDRGLLEGLVRR
jgi:1,2-diacylglycerol 3-alpha-glucosyltransferase